MPPDRDLRPPAGPLVRGADDSRRRPGSTIPLVAALAVGLAAAVHVHLGFRAPDDPAPPMASTGGAAAPNDSAEHGNATSARPPERVPPARPAPVPAQDMQWVSHDWIEIPPRARIGGLGHRRSAMAGGTPGYRPEFVGSSWVHPGDDPALCRTCLLHQLVRGGL